VKDRNRIGILTPFIDGYYFGGITYHVRQMLHDRGFDLIAVQTTLTGWLLSDPEMEIPLAFDHVVGWIAIYQSITESLTDRIIRSGKPLVLIGKNFAENNISSVAIDNSTGMFSAVDHLIRHGHRRIAFLGSTKKHEFQQRYLGYLRALKYHGIPYDPDLVFMQDDFFPTNGRRIAQQFAEKGLPCSAIAISTDFAAAAFVERIQELGIQVPEDIAVIGLDNSYHSKDSQPSITSVDQPLNDLAEAAVNILLERLHAPDLPGKAIILSPRLICRRSCGCIQKTQTSPELLVSEKMQDQKNIQYLRSKNHDHYRISQSLISASVSDLREMSWLKHTNVAWGCYAQRMVNEDGKTVFGIEHLYDPGNLAKLSIGMQFTAEQFPPLQHFTVDASFWDRHMVLLCPVETNHQNRGFLTYIKPFDHNSHNELVNTETMNQLTLLFGAAQERAELMEQIKQREKKYRAAVEQLEIVSKTTTDSIWIWDFNTGRIELNERIHNIKFPRPASGTLDIQTFLEHIHPEDLTMVEQALYDHIRHNTPFQVEYRLQRKDGTYFWVYSTGQVILNEEGLPIRMIGSLRDIEERKQAEQRIAYLAYHDSLTGLPNRLFFYTKLQQALDQARKEQQRIAVMLVDLDRFKVLNDTYGHQLGDKLISYIAGQLLEHVPEQAIVARLGGDEFIVMLPHLKNRNEAPLLASRLLQALQRPFIDGTIEFHVTGSIGISSYPEDGDTVDALIQCADIAMYRAKSEGKNKAAIYSHALNQHSANRLKLENALRKALSRNEFILHYQPQIDLQTGAIYGVEALLRWHSREYGLVPPLDFIPLAEETGLIIPVGQWVLQEACRQAASWEQEGLQQVTVAVNISARQFMQPDFVEQVMQVLAATKLDPSRLCLEITESMAIQNVDYSIDLLSELKHLGIRISMDDFGTGYSSLALLKRLPLHVVKIDKSFVSDITVNASDAAIVQAIIAMAHSIDLVVVAEGVETREQAMLLREQGCDSIQGYYAGKPMPAEHLHAVLHKRTKG
jgi:diguanylate cyclase (GGDEF)-like protein